MKNLYLISNALSLRRKKNKLWKKFSSSHSPLDLSNFKKVSNELRKLTRDLRKDFEKHLISNVRTKPKAFWQYINSRIKTCPSIDELYRPDGLITSFHPEMPKLLNDYFSSVFTHEDTNSIPTLQSDDQPPPIHTFQFTPVSVLNKITNLKSDKSPGPDS